MCSIYISLLHALYMLLVKQHFLHFCPLEGKNSAERQKAVFNSNSFIKQSKITLSRRNESRLCGNQKQPRSEGRVGFFRVVAIPPRVLCHSTDRLIGSFRLYNLFLSVQALTHKHPVETHCGGQKPQG